MKKWLLFALTLVPLAAGHLIDITTLVPVVGSAAFYLVPLAATAFWFWLGRQYAKTDWGPGRAMLIGNAIGLISLVLYLWQFELQSSETRDVFWAGLSQKYFTATPLFLLGRFARLFPHPVTVLMLLAFLLLAAVFAWGFFSGRKEK